MGHLQPNRMWGPLLKCPQSFLALHPTPSSPCLKPLISLALAFPSPPLLLYSALFLPLLHPLRGRSNSCFLLREETDHLFLCWALLNSLPPHPLGLKLQLLSQASHQGFSSKQAASAQRMLKAEAKIINMVQLIIVVYLSIFPTLICFVQLSILHL